jgi:hypothetical protein
MRYARGLSFIIGRSELKIANTQDVANAIKCPPLGGFDFRCVLQAKIGNFPTHVACRRATMFLPSPRPFLRRGALKSRFQIAMLLTPRRALSKPAQALLHPAVAPVMISAPRFYRATELDGFAAAASNAASRRT